ncbi:hypothetical protein [Paenibacillus jiagnxiensis]|uniref:hypothetical protein n=1 Tax=Paenibacillus jiagnxiensis TaxID=3228926 RepID=UPI0038D3A0F9
MQKILNENTMDIGTKPGWVRFKEAYSRYFSVVLSRNNVTMNKALILGAGNGNDIDISFFEERFQEIVLVDIDEEALNRFIGKAKRPEKFRKAVIDLTGLEGKLTPVIFEKFQKKLIEYVGRLKPSHDFSQLKDEKFDFIFSCNFTTQLLHPYFTTMFMTKGTVPGLNILDPVTKLSHRIIKSLIIQIHSLLDPQGVFIHSSDIVEATVDKTSGMKTPGYDLIMGTLGLDWSDITSRVNAILPMMARNNMFIGGSGLPELNFFKVDGYSFIPWEFVRSEKLEKTYICRVVSFLKK